MSQINDFSGHPVRIERKNNRNMYMRLERDGTLHITCPYRMTNQEILNFLNEKRSWIEKAEKRLTAERENMMTGEDGKEAVWLGERYKVNMFVSRDSRMTVDSLHHQISYYLPSFSTDAIRLLFYRTGNEKLAEMIKERRDRLDQIICIANHKQPPKITIRYTTSQWGSCTPAHHAVSISSRLIHYPTGCLDYVLTHEYVHILVPNHSRHFYDLVEKYMPDWKIYSDKLKQRI